MQKLTGLLAALLVLAAPAFAQGVTTAAIHGSVTGPDGESLPGANVVATHVPSGTVYGAATMLDGRYNLSGLRIGGPYRLEASFVGYQARAVEGFDLAIGQDLGVDFALSEAALEIGEVEVTAVTDPVLNSDRTGAATFVDQAEIEALPTISRSTQDFTRLTPQASGLSFGGRNVLYNNFSLDGSIFNNPYGLDSPVPGGQTGAEPVSLEAVEQVQVSLAPYDVRQGGFTGAGVNTVTKSGTNAYRATAYTFLRNESLLGGTVAGQEILKPDLSFNQSGASVSGPIVEDRLFFYVNAELERRDDDGAAGFRAFEAGDVAGTPGISRAQAARLQQISDALRESYGYETGPFQGYVNETNNDKVLAKLDWNVTRNHTASLRFNYLNAERQLPPHPFAISINNSGRGPNQNTLPFRNSGYTINNDIYSFVGEVNSRFSNRFSNNLIVGFTAFRDFRTPFSEPFPTIEIAEEGVTYTTVGHEPFSINNVLDQDVFQFTNNATFYLNQHTLTGGVNYEQFGFANSFNLFYYGLFPVPADLDFDGDGVFEPLLDFDGDGVNESFGSSFSSVDNFLETTDPNNPNYRDYRAEAAANTAPFANALTDIGQAAVYGQDEYRASDDLKVTVGLRVDVPVYLSDIPVNNALLDVAFEDANDNPEQLDVSRFPDARLLWSPRVGVNWDVLGNRAVQVRGGTGIFTGRLPFVWIGNQTSNQGADNPTAIGTVNNIAEGFRWPQVWKTNLALDHVLPYGFLGTVEGIYGKDLDAIYVRNANLARPVGVSALDGRPVFDPSANALNANVGGAYVLDNADEGYQYSVTAQLRKQFGFGLGGQLAYTFSEAKDVMTSTEIAQFVFEGNAVSGDPNRPQLAPSQFGLRHRVVGAASYRAAYAGRFATTVGLFFEAGKGDRFSYTYAGDLNGDGVSGNDLVYVPADVRDLTLVAAGDPSTPAGDAAYDRLAAYIAQDDYLSERRGEISERNGALSPWFTQIDLRIAQEIMVPVLGRQNSLELSFNIQNLGNLLNSDWGVREFVAARQILQYEGTADGTPAGTPLFSVPSTVGETTFVPDASLLSRWRAQFGVKYTFGA